MPQHITDTTQLKCGKGTIPTPLSVTSQSFMKIEGKLQATEEDKKPNVNSKKKVLQVEWSKINITKGIITFDVSGWSDASGHFTLWDGNHLIYPGGAEHDDPQSSKYYFHMLHPTKKKKW